MGKDAASVLGSRAEEKKIRNTITSRLARGYQSDDDDETNGTRSGGGVNVGNFSSCLFESGMQGEVDGRESAKGNESKGNNATVYSEDKVTVQEAVRVVKPREPSADPHYAGRSKLL